MEKVKGSLIYQVYWGVIRQEFESAKKLESDFIIN